MYNVAIIVVYILDEWCMILHIIIDLFYISLYYEWYVIICISIYKIIYYILHITHYILYMIIYNMYDYISVYYYIYIIYNIIIIMQSLLYYYFYPLFNSYYIPTANISAL